MPKSQAIGASISPKSRKAPQTTDQLYQWLDNSRLHPVAEYAREHQLDFRDLLSLELGFLAKLEPDIGQGLLRMVSQLSFTFTPTLPHRPTAVNGVKKEEHEDLDLVSLKEELAKLRQVRKDMQLQVVRLVNASKGNDK